MARYVKIRIPALLVSLLFFALQVHSGQYDYEYKDGPQQPVNPGESPEHNFGNCSFSKLVNECVT